ncbi:hypothetical protein BDM02DRAFT_3189684 [Thelephora ganbajun]|uniref:Uncharacterized protein n=1 Tax=Thelephora ganbajun TaxID=370292 RepID=A0ACB6Z7H8_THEGA|nr:hypothetical protein BDM02DRAFT_3189684 [Thelephora ganbajun]
MVDKKDIGTGHIRNADSVGSRRSVLDFVRARFRRFIRNPVVVWFAGIAVTILVVIMLMILLLNIGVVGVDDLLADIPLNVTGIAIIGHIYHLDLETRALSISWVLAGCGDYRLPSYPDHFGRTFTTCSPPDRPVDVYFDRSREAVFSYDPTMLPQNRSTHQSFYIPNFMEFPQDHRLAVYAGAVYIPPPVDARHWFDQPILAPYDDYVLDVEAFVIDTATNQSLSILKLSAADPTDNFYAGDQVDWETENTFNGGRVSSKHFRMRVKRSFLSKIFTTILLIVNWFLTAGCLRITLLSVVGHKKIGEGVLLLPITVILTIPALRQLYVGSPPFGILIDVVGLFLQIIIVSLCSLVLLMRIVRDRKRALERGKEKTQEEGLYQDNAIMEEDETAQRLYRDDDDDDEHV